MFTIIENILNSFESIRTNKLRAALSMLGIIIGVASVIILNAMGNGSTQKILGVIEELGTNILTITPGGGYGSSRGRVGSTDVLTEKLASSIKENISGLDGVLPIINSNGQIVYGGKDMFASIYGIDENYLSTRNIKIEYGINLNEQNIKNLDKVAIIGQDVVSEIFAGKNPIGEKIKIGNNVFDVIGIIESSLMYDSAMFIPITTSSIRIAGQKHYSQLVIAVTDSNLVKEKEIEVNNLLLKDLKVIDPNNPPYKIMNQGEMLESVTSIMETMTLFLAGIAAISLLVGGIGVMNIMLVSVTERTKEIGIRKAIGASGTDILLQFLTEASTLSILGGIIGILLSYFVVYIVGYFGIPAQISTNSILLSFGFSLGIGLIFGILPAYKAAQLRPIDALRFE